MDAANLIYFQDPLAIEDTGRSIRLIRVRAGLIAYFFVRSSF